VLFDAYGTLFDVYSVSLLAEQLFPGFGERLAVCGATSRSTTRA
jgi:2-haloacid dehalogenase